jgi:hypothetical protein
LYIEGLKDKAETLEIYINEVGMVTVLGLAVRSLISGRGKKFFLFKNVHERLWGPAGILFNRYRYFFPGVRRPGREVDHSSSSTAEVKNEWSYTSAPPISPNGVRRDNFTLYLSLNVEPLR